jgi:hypothetical protein
MMRGYLHEAVPAGNQPNSQAQAKRGSRRIFHGGLSGHQKVLIGLVGRGRLVGDKGQLEVVDDAVHHGIVREASDNLHRAAAARAEQGVILADLLNHLGLALAGDGPDLVLPPSEKEKARGFYVLRFHLP